jgi:glycosyltransferase involved in cell wall biosynthesis
VAGSLSIVVPLYNERDNVAAVLGELLAWCERTLPARGFDFELVVVDDASTDGCGELVPKHARVRVLRHARNQGLTGALRTGYSAAQMELVTWCPGDGQIAPAAIGALLDAHRGEAMVISAYHHRPDGIVRAIMSQTARLLLRAAIGFGDRLEGIYLFRRALLDEIGLVSTRSAGIVAFELAAKVRRRGLPIASTTIACLPRRAGRSKVADARNIAEFLADLWLIRRSLSRDAL